LSSGTIFSTVTDNKPFFNSAPVTSIYSPSANVRVNLRAAIPL
jgi:hypothetical protein